MFPDISLGRQQVARLLNMDASMRKQQTAFCNIKKESTYTFWYFNIAIGKGHL